MQCLEVNYWRPRRSFVQHDLPTKGCGVTLLCVALCENVSQPRGGDLRRCTSASNDTRSERACMMTTRRSKIRARKMQAQLGRCHYCRQPMWTGDAAEFCKRYRMKHRRAWRHECTAEHLYARSEGGSDSDDNIVAACRYCNWTRHRSPSPLSPNAYARKVRKQLKAGGWHGFVAVSVA